MCGGVRFEVSEPLVRAGYCHCTRCRRRSGAAASPQARAAPGSVRVVKGEDLVRSYVPPGGFADDFCGRCGSQLFSRDPDDATQVNVRLGAFDGDPGIRPQYRHYTATAAVWEPMAEDGLPRHPDQRPG
jgi:hypothetical protein